MGSDIITMSLKELDRLSVLEEVISCRLSQSEAALRLGLSRRHIVRLCKGLRRLGPESLISKRRGAPSNNRLDGNLLSQVIALITEHYQDFGPTLAHEKLTQVHGLVLSRESVRQIMLSNGIWKGKSRSYKKAVHQMRSRRPCFGELVQIDGSLHAWFEGRRDPCCLIVFIDDATSRLVALHFVEAECTQGYFDAVSQHIGRYGRPMSYYSDKHGIFRVNTQEADSGNGLTQFGRACRELGIELICANTPQAKGRVERANSTLQDRLVKELRLRHISDIDSANAFLPTFIEQYNQRFAIEPTSSEDAHHKTLPPKAILAHILSIKENRRISKSLGVSYQNKLYQIQTTTPAYSMRNQMLTVCKTKEGISLLYKGQFLKYTVMDKHNRPTPTVEAKDLNAHLNRKKRTYRPSSDHPWKKYYPDPTPSAAYTQGPQAYSANR